ncbi:hypothetical protein AVEN_193202-1 [Araneus ventricosus]|uniref:Uncharacterized protein n=1 Tax=Araneus ventricosus TaxID=182803 RepID=A0A4Y2B179_ARAVE|nr:hypothetical protein AVEN_193202-1 [Araneus ventricosus]
MRAVFWTDLVNVNYDEMTRTISELAHPLQTSAPHQREDVWHLTYDLTCKRPTYTADLQCNRVSNLEPSGPKAETLSLGHRGPHG